MKHWKNISKSFSIKDNREIVVYLQKKAFMMRNNTRQCSQCRCGTGRYIDLMNCGVCKLGETPEIYITRYVCWSQWIKFKFFTNTNKKYRDNFHEQVRWNIYSQTSWFRNHLIFGQVHGEKVSIVQPNFDSLSLTGQPFHADTYMISHLFLRSQIKEIWFSSKLLL